jgi:hypothetical protein
VEDGAVDRFPWFLEVADEDLAAGFGEIMDYALSYAGGATGNDGGLALELVTWN